MGCATSIDLLMAVAARTNYTHVTKPDRDAFAEAVRLGNFDAARALIRHYDTMYSETQWKEYLFDKILCYLSGTASPSAKEYIAVHSNQDQNLLDGLDLLLQAQAVVDRPFMNPQDLFIKFQPRIYNIRWFGTAIHDFPPIHPTVLDRAYYIHIGIFRKLEHWSHFSSVHITRAGICIAAKESTESLRLYLQSRLAWDSGYSEQLLQCTLLEQALRWPSDIDLDIIQSLIDYGVDVRLPGVPHVPQGSCPLSWPYSGFDASFLFWRITAAAQWQGSSRRSRTILTHLLQAEAKIGPMALNAAVEVDGTSFLTVSSDLGAGIDFRENGVRALVAAAHLGNHEAVEWLIHKGVDVNGFITQDNGEQLSVLAEAFYSVEEDTREEVFASPGMLHCLIHHGA